MLTPQQVFETKLAEMAKRILIPRWEEIELTAQQQISAIKVTRVPGFCDFEVFADGYMTDGNYRQTQMLIHALEERLFQETRSAFSPEEILHGCVSISRPSAHELANLYA